MRALEDFCFFDHDDSMGVPDDNEAGPSNLGKQYLGRELAEEDAQVESEELPEAFKAAAPIKMSKNLKEEWQKRFAEAPQQQTANIFHPFDSQLEWEVANWGIVDSPSNAAFDRLLAIPGIRNAT